MEICHPLAQKSYGLARLADHLGIDAEEIVAIGDVTGIIQKSLPKGRKIQLPIGINIVVQLTTPQNLFYLTGYLLRQGVWDTN